MAKAYEEILDAEKDLAQGQRDYNEGLAELRDGEREYLDAKEDVEEELAEAYAELMDAEEEIKKLEVPKWYVLDRNSNISFVSFELNSEKVSAVAKVFPIFFYMIAALVTLTTMTRMIEEERTQIGTLKALGYSKMTITAKYIVYCGLASFLGSAGGLFVGFKLIPYIIWNAYGVLFHLPDFIAAYNTRIGLIASGLAILSTLGATIYACNDALKEKPATLMLPRAPKAGKRIMLERIKFIWSRLSFNHKATARNLFRYKKHFFMTVIGISGCTALLVTGFGLRDSIGELATTQFNEIFKYELEIEVDNGWKDDTAFNEMLEDKSFIDSSIAVYSHKGDVSFKDEKEEVIIRATNLEELGEFIEFKDRASNEKLMVNKESIFITEKLSEVLELDVGDEFQLTNSDEKVAEFIVTGITENYAGNYVYMDEELFISSFNVVEEENFILAKPVDIGTEFEDIITEKMLSNEKVLNSTFVSQTKSTFDNLLAAIDYIIVFIIVSSGALAFIVLYNLTNININERNKELATLKVLGYYEEEVSTYIFRETRILTFIGMLVGLGLGNLLHAFVIITVESPSFMFGRDIKLFSYLISGLITIIFSVIVNLFMKKKLANIKMVDSMKAND
ncbi:MAG: ABC transporter permease [Tissierella sp.]|nr:ABC transporter permease [Tissierella sp.]